MLTRSLALPLLATAAMAQPMIIKTTTLFDGSGHVRGKRQITIENGRITRISAAKDEVAIDRNPPDDITAARRVVFVVKHGRVYKDAPPAR